MGNEFQHFYSIHVWMIYDMKRPPVVTANPEKAALYFITGVCFGLILTLCLLVIRISCHAHSDTTGAISKKEDDGSEEEDEEDDEEEEVGDGSPTATDLALANHTQAPTSSSVNVFTSAEELERAQLLEERERIIREIWRSGQPDILGSGWHQFEMEMLPNGGQREHRTWSPNSHGKY
ncbi:eva-1 homolog Ba isoform X2 [Narcine bancroftii]|uniref:eva-1 homolog Ba isoform X2 n=1 Tax=Narcine bancroftii TaxID=1343680 RepID=UPI0038313A3B